MSNLFKIVYLQNIYCMIEITFSSFSVCGLLWCRGRGVLPFPIFLLLWNHTLVAWCWMTCLSVEPVNGTVCGHKILPTCCLWSIIFSISSYTGCLRSPLLGSLVEVSCLLCHYSLWRVATVFRQYQASDWLVAKPHTSLSFTAQSVLISHQ